MRELLGAPAAESALPGAPGVVPVAPGAEVFADLGLELGDGLDEDEDEDIFADDAPTDDTYGLNDPGVDSERGGQGGTA